jgi:hypothetical protein
MQKMTSEQSIIDSLASAESLRSYLNDATKVLRQHLDVAFPLDRDCEIKGVLWTIDYRLEDALYYTHNAIALLRARNARRIAKQRRLESMMQPEKLATSCLGTPMGSDYNVSSVVQKGF